MKHGDEMPVERIRMGLCEHCKALAAKDAEIAAENDELREWRNVIAIICRDGGHYHQKNGTKATAEFCKKDVLSTRTQLDAANEQISDQAGTMKSMDSAIALLHNRTDDQVKQIEQLREQIKNLLVENQQLACDVAEKTAEACDQRRYKLAETDRADGLVRANEQLRVENERLKARIAELESPGRGEHDEQVG